MGLKYWSIECFPYSESSHQVSSERDEALASLAVSKDALAAVESRERDTASALDAERARATLAESELEHTRADLSSAEQRASAMVAELQVSGMPHLQLCSGCVLNRGILQEMSML